MIATDTIKITPEILNLIAEIESFNGRWQFFSQLAPERLSSLRKIATIESIGSSTRIEGAKLSDQQIEHLLSCLDTQSLRTRDEQEVAGYAVACEKIFEHYKEMPLTENMIKQMHIWLLEYSKKDDRHRGWYKNIPIRIEAFNLEGKSVGIIFETVSPLETPIKMEELVSWTRDHLKKKSLHSILVIAIFIVLFLAIHPFQDGNGRLSRLLTTFLMMKVGYLYVPYSSLESIIEANKESYYLALQKTQTSWLKGNPDWNPWLLFFLTCLQRQKHHLEVKISKEKLLIEKLSSLSRQILDLLKAHGPLKISEIQILTQSNRNTLKKALSVLTNDHYISMHGKGKASFYQLGSF